VLVSDFHYDLPEELIAQEPPADRAGSRMLWLPKEGEYEDRKFREFPDLLRPDDLVVFNNTRVFPARLYGRRGGILPHFSQSAREMGHPENQNPRSVAKDATRVGQPRNFPQGRIEVLLTRQVSDEPNEWECLVRPGRKIGVGERLYFGENDELQAEVIGRGGFGERRIRFAEAPRSGIPTSRARTRTTSAREMGHPADDFFRVLERIGHVPLPPYIARADAEGDRERYQTVYARERGSVAAPTAGLHFTAEILERLRARGIETAEITLHVGLGTFQPVRVETVEEHKLHAEVYSISEAAAEKIERARREGRRVVAVGTTTVRTLEYAAQIQNPQPLSPQTRTMGGALPSGEVRAGSGEANLFIYPGYEFRVVGAMLTNFHLPESTLLMLVCGFGGKENVMRAYEHAVQERYRFYSYGDCMLVEQA
jgi:S-adenosylmethionine:tRNA ribosyltransferase-isomerase